MEERMRVALERKAMEPFEERRLDKGLSVKALAVCLYPDVSAANARMSLSRLREPQINDRPKRLLFGDFVDLCATLDMVPKRIVSQTIAEVLEQEK